METLLTYFIKVSVLVSLFYIAYWLLLKKETFFAKNRLFLILGLLTSLVLPLITITKTIWIESEPIVYQEAIYIPFDGFEPETIHNTVTEKVKPEINWSYIVAGLYLVGILFFLIKFVLSSLSLYKILHKTPIKKLNGYKIIDHKSVKSPFSFFDYIAFDSSSFSEEELENIIKHEKVHSDQKHSVDVLLSELILILFWLNPFVWLYRKAILQNLEFIADDKAINTSVNRVNYQKTLLKITLNPEKLTLANPFYQPLIKKRIMMLNKNKSRKINAIKYTLVLPILVLFVMQFQTKVVAQVKEKTKESISKEKQSNLIVTDTIVWVKDFSKEHEKEMKNQSSGEKNIVKISSWEDIKKLLKIEPENNTLGENALILINGQDISEFKKMKIEEFEFEGLISIITYTKQEAIEKFGEKAKDGAIIIEGEITNLDIKTSSKYNNQKDEVNSPEFQKKIKEIERKAKEIEAQANSPEFQKKIKEIEKKAKEIEAKANSPEFQKRIKEAEQRAKEAEERVNSPEFQKRIKEAEQRAKEAEERVNSPEFKQRIKEAEQRAKEAEERVNSPEFKQRIKEAEQRAKEAEERVNSPEFQKRIKEAEQRAKEAEQRRKEYDSNNFSVSINKNTTDLQIKEFTVLLKSQNIEMKVSSIKRNKNGEIIKIKISLSENSGTKDNKKESKSEATFDTNETIPEIIVGKRNGNLTISNNR